MFFKSRSCKLDYVIINIPHFFYKTGAVWKKVLEMCEKQCIFRNPIAFLYLAF